MSDQGVRSRTAEEILDIAEMLIQTRGYNAFSFQDISDRLGIRKASIHYHYASKAILGVAVVERYSTGFSEALQAVEADENQTAMDMFDCYTGPYREFAGTPDRVCLCGALAGEILALPGEMRERVEAFFDMHLAWLTRIVARGVKRGEFQFSATEPQMARTLFSALQGALLVKRTTGDSSQMEDVIEVLKGQLRRASQES